MDISRAEPFVAEALERWCKPSRIEHSRSVAVTAETLCERFGLDPERGRLAGLAHDIAKDRPLPEQWAEARAAASYPELAFIAAAVARMEAEPAFADKIILEDNGKIRMLGKKRIFPKLIRVQHVHVLLERPGREHP